MGKNAHGPRGNNAPKKPASKSVEDAAPSTSDKGKGKKKHWLDEEEPKPQNASKSKSKGKAEGEVANDDQPKKPTTREIIAGASWTGKLPMNLLAEHCQKQKWEKPEYTMRKNDAGFLSSVILRSKHMKTGEVTELPQFRLPKDKEEIGLRPTAAEARHFAATYALYRISNMKNIHMMLPPSYRDLWKGEFEEMKKEDVAGGKSWMYEADPFLAAKTRADEKIQKEKEREKRAKIAASIQDLYIPGMDSNEKGIKSKGWGSAPRVELGKKLRREIENIVQKYTLWNVNSHHVSAKERLSIIEKLVTAGFRKPHVEEAMRYCRDRDEALEWLLIHVPEDDLPKWALPENYIAGVSMASGNLSRDAAVKRLAASGYSVEDCEECYDGAKGDERKAAQLLQDRLLGYDIDLDMTDYLDRLSINPAKSETTTHWNEEQEVLESIFNDRYERLNKDACRIQLEKQVGQTNIHVNLRKPLRGYPNEVPILGLETPLPAYIRLSILRNCLTHARTNFLGDQMIFNIVDWLENETERLIQHPEDLAKLKKTGVAAVDADLPEKKSLRKFRQQIRPLDRTQGSASSQKVLNEWQQRQQLPNQRKMNQFRETLPAWQVRDNLCKAVNNCRVVIVSGETGSGKSTQTVQFVLDQMINEGFGGSTKIICTQPRRISALGLADRVAEERCVSVGTEVGYSIRGESKQTNETKITFVTTGVLLRRMQSSGGNVEDLVQSLADISHVVIDEVHERSLDTDLLLALIKNVLQVRLDLRVILMSATLDAEVFEGYFGKWIGKENVGKIHISGRTHPVEDLYLDDVLQLTNYNPIPNGSTADADGKRKDMSKAIQSVGMGINYQLIANLVECIDLELGHQDGSILIFLPGTVEINRTLDALRDLSGLYALPLHASLLPAEQRRVFPSPPKGKRKVIASTNVAETSITIPDVVVVIDTGRVKETRYDPVTSMSKLEEVWASRAACKQRRGRAGRVREGTCYKLFTRDAESKMVENPEPEMRRVPLEQLCLNVRGMGIPDVQKFLTTSTLTPPDSLAVDGAMSLLRRIGAMDGEDLTALGQHLATIPADLRCAKLMIYGALFGCFEACITIASILTVKSPFVSPSDKREESKAARESFSNNAEGDILADMRAYDSWSERRRTSSAGEVRRWCDSNFLSWNTLNDISTTRSQYISSLQDAGFLPVENSNTGSPLALHANRNEKSTRLLQSLLLSALHPQTLRIAFPSQKYTSTVSGTFAMDPESRAIKFFDETNTRVFVHPASTLFSAQSYGFANFLCYFTRAQTSKIFVRELTPAGCYGMLLFGGVIEIDTAGRGLLVDGWVRIKGWARIGVLISRLRGLLDEVLRQWFENPAGRTGKKGAQDMEKQVVDIARRLVELEGMDM